MPDLKQISGGAVPNWIALWGAADENPQIVAGPKMKSTPDWSAVYEAAFMLAKLLKSDECSGSGLITVVTEAEIHITLCKSNYPHMTVALDRVPALANSRPGFAAIGPNDLLGQRSFLSASKAS